jgi:hypothetical protein
VSFMDRLMTRLSHRQQRAVLWAVRVGGWGARHPMSTLSLVIGVYTGSVSRWGKRRRATPTEMRRFASSDVRRMQPREVKRYAAVLALATLALNLLRLPLRPRRSGFRTIVWIALDVAGAVLTIWLVRWTHAFIEFWGTLPEDEEQRKAAIRQKLAEWQERARTAHEEWLREHGSADDGEDAGGDQPS